MERTRFIEHRGRRILLFDYANLRDSAVILEGIRHSKAFVARLPLRKEILTLTDVTGSTYNTDILNALKDLAAHNAPYVAAGAVVTTSGIHKIAIMAVATFSRRKLHAFGTLDEAKDWLAAQAEAAAA